jgi:hypothetical protein
MLSRPFKRSLRRECRGIMQVLPVLCVALVFSVAAGPVLTLAASHFASPISPVSPIKPPTVLFRGAAVAPAETILPPVEPVLPTAVEEPLQPIVPTPSPEVTAVPTTAPTLWIVAGLLAVGAIAAGLIVLKKE